MKTYSNVLISLQLTKNDAEFLTVEVSSKKVRVNKSGFIKIMSKKVIRNTVDISTRESTWKKVRGNNVDISTIEITLKKYVWTT